MDYQKFFINYFKIVTQDTFDLYWSKFIGHIKKIP